LIRSSFSGEARPFRWAVPIGDLRKFTREPVPGLVASLG
jgi:hypothetical protein